jgi:hypothetical protein
MKSLLIQRCPLWTLQSYDFDIHKIYGQSTPNEKALEVPSAILGTVSLPSSLCSNVKCVPSVPKTLSKDPLHRMFCMCRVYQETVPMDHVPCALSQVLHS